MERAATKRYRTIPILIFSFLILSGGLYSTMSQADTLSSPVAGVQLAYFVGYHSSPGYVYYGPQYYHHHQKKLYWSGWRHTGHGCRKNCLIDRWSGHVVRCKRLCR